MAQAQGLLRSGAQALLLLLIGGVTSLAGLAGAVHAGPAPQSAVTRLSLGTAAGHPALAITAEGMLHAVWDQGSRLQHAWREGPGTPWVLADEPMPMDGCSAPSLVASGNTLYLAYVQTVDGRGRIYYRRWQSGQWSVPIPVSEPGADAGEPAVAANARGDAVIVWASRQAVGDPILRYSATDLGLHVPRTVLAGRTPARGRHPAVAIGEDGAIHVAWEASYPELGQPEPEILYNDTAEGLWDLAVLFISSSSAVPSSRPSLALDSQGRPHFAWQEGGQGPNGIAEVYYNSIEGLGHKAQVLSSGLQRAHGPRLAGDSRGSLHAVWDEGGAILRYRRTTAGAGGAWQEPVDLVTGELGVSDPALAVDGAGAVHCVWTQLDGAGTPAIYYLAYPEPAETPSPTWTSTPEATPSPTPTSTPEATPSPTPTNTPEAMPSPSPTPSATAPAAPWRVYLPWMADLEHDGGPARPARRLAGLHVELPPTAVPAVSSQGHDQPAGPGPLALSAAAAQARNPAITRATTGALHVVWEQGMDLYHAYRAPGGAWSAPEWVAVGQSPALAAAPDGAVHLAYVNEFFGNYDIYHVQWNGEQWSLPRNVSRTSAGASSLPDIAVAHDGSVHFAWADTSPGYGVIYYAYLSGGVYSTQLAPNARGSAPTLALTRDGEGNTLAHLAWQDSGDGGSGALDIYYTVRYSATAWELPQNISDSAEGDSRNPDLITEGDELRLVWQENGESRTVRTVQGHSGWWQVPLPVSPGEEDAYLPAVAAAGGVTHIAWDTGAAVRLVQAWSAAGAWPQPITLVAGADETAEVAVAAGPDGEAHVAWAQRQGEQWAVYYAEHRFQPACSLSLPLAVR